jgi:purine-binding chemotaxis protein CheW
VSAGGRLCAIPLHHVREVMRPQPTRAFGSALAFVDGVATIRGEPTPVINLATLLGATERSVPTRLATLRIGARQVALAVDAIHGIQPVAPGQLVAWPPLLRESGAGYAECLARLDGELVVVLDSVRLVHESLPGEGPRSGDPT